ncbi:MAG TPA: restriction endonuclease [Acidobacteriaceae bacterium]
MNFEQSIPHSELSNADLQVDAIYQGGRKGNASDDPLHILMGVSNSGGFRYRGKLGSLDLLVLTTTLTEPDWPDALDKETGAFTYYGDNRHPGRALHDTPRFGNEILRSVFETAHMGGQERHSIPPIFLFSSTGNWRDVRFLGLAVPGSPHPQASEDLVAVWKTIAGRRFQNYRARFTVLDAATIPRTWITDLVQGGRNSPHAPSSWKRWVSGGLATPLLAQRTIVHRSKAEQLPSDTEAIAIIKTLHGHFAENPHAFEHCAAAMSRLLLPDITSLDVTRPSRDGGRDGIGKLRIGAGEASIMIDFALEAKCYGMTASVGVRDISRLISRLRHRQFGILVTTSYVEAQAYKEIKEDGHPIIILAAVDIVALLRAHGYVDPTSLSVWLEREFPTAQAS